MMFIFSVCLIDSGDPRLEPASREHRHLDRSSQGTVLEVRAARDEHVDLIVTRCGNVWLPGEGWPVTGVSPNLDGRDQDGLSGPRNRSYSLLLRPVSGLRGI